MAFKPGESGNPKGRPRGIKDARHRWRKRLESQAPALVDKALAMALEGDSQALKLCLERLIPAVRPAAQTVTFTAKSDALGDQAAAIVEAAGQGQMPPDIAASLLSALASTVRIAEFDQIEKRLAALEAQAGLDADDK